VRLTDYKIICIHDIDYVYDEFDVLDDMNNFTSMNGLCLKGLMHFSDIGLGKIPRLLAPRFVDDPDVHASFSFEFLQMDVCLPRLLYHFGYEYTVSRYRESMIDGDSDSVPSFHVFAHEMWLWAATKPDLLPFIRQAEGVESINGKLYGTIREDQSSANGMELYLRRGNDIMGQNLRYMNDFAVIFTHLLEDFFDH